MRFRSAILLLVTAAWAVDLKPPSVTRGTYLDYAATGNPLPDGDTMRASAWGPTGTFTYNGAAQTGTIYSAMNDGGFNTGSPACPGSINLFVVKIVNLDFNTLGNNSIANVNCMSGYGGSGGCIPAGWCDGSSHGYCNSSLTIYNTAGCSQGWKSAGMWSVDGKLYLNIYRQEAATLYYAHDSSVLRSDDNGLHWCNPATITANSGSCPSNATTAAGDAPATPSVSGWALWPDTWSTTGYPNPNKAGRVMPFQMCQDYSMNCPTVANGHLVDADCDPTTYVCFTMEDGVFDLAYLGRVSKANMPNLNPTQWQYRQSNGTWTSGAAGLASAAVIFGLGDYQTGSQFNRVGTPNGINLLASPVYLPDYGAYVLFSHAQVTSWAAHPWGPYTAIPAVLPKYFEVNKSVTSGVLATFTHNLGTANVSMTCSDHTSHANVSVALAIAATKNTMTWTPAATQSLDCTVSAGQNDSFVTPILATYTGNALSSSIVTTGFVTYGTHSSGGSPAYQLQNMTFGSSWPAKGTQLIGTSAFRYSMSNSPTTLPRRGLLLALDFYPPNGSTTGNIYANDYASDTTNPAYCVGTDNTKYGIPISNVLSWQTYGMFFDQIAGCSMGVSAIGGGTAWAQNFTGSSYFTGNVPYTLLAVVNVSTANGNVFRALGDFGGPGLRFAWRGGLSARTLCLEGATACTTNQLTLGAWYLVAAVYRGGGTGLKVTGCSTGVFDGNCTVDLYYGSTIQNATMVGTTFVPNYTPGTIAIPLPSGGNPYTGAMVYAWAYGRAFTQTDMAEFYRSVKNIMARSGRITVWGN